MKLTILGAGCSVIKKDWKSSSCLLEIGEEKLLFDIGWGPLIHIYEGTLIAKEMDYLFITHPHPDHMGGLMNFLQSMYVDGLYYDNPRTKPLVIHAYDGFKKDFEQIKKMTDPGSEYPFKLIIKESNEETTYDSFIVESSEVTHVPEYFSSSAFRIESEGKSFVYSGDCGYDTRFVALAKNADVAVLECSSSPALYAKFGPTSNHLSPIECGKIAKEANIKTLVLSHRYANVDEGDIEKEVRREFKGGLLLGRDTMSMNI